MTRFPESGQNRTNTPEPQNSIMAPFLHQRVKRIIVVMLFIFCLADTGTSSKRSKLKVAIEEDNIEEPCLPCEVLFSKLERTGVDGKLSQDVRVQERGEPKSGTGVSYFWAAAALTHACDYLQELFGEEPESSALAQTESTPYVFICVRCSGCRDRKRQPGLCCVSCSSVFTLQYHPHEAITRSCSCQLS